MAESPSDVRVGGHRDALALQGPCPALQALRGRGLDAGGEGGWPGVELRRVVTRGTPARLAHSRRKRAPTLCQTRKRTWASVMSAGSSESTRLGARHVWLASLFLLALFVGPGCGASEEYTATSATAAEVRVVQKWDEGAGLYFEGARSYVAVETVAGERLFEAELEPLPTGDSTSFRLDPGEYRLVSWQRPCDGSCDEVDPPTDRCSAQMIVRPDGRIRARITVRAEAGCTIRFGEDVR